MADEWGPLGSLVGEWQGEGGLDTAYSHAQHKVLATPYLEKLTFKPFGPVANGRQALYGLDYKSAMWRGTEENPFHTEVGYWLWDGTSGELVRGFVVPTASRCSPAASPPLMRSRSRSKPSRAIRNIRSARTSTWPRTLQPVATASRSGSTTTRVGPTTKPPCFG